MKIVEEDSEYSVIIDNEYLAELIQETDTKIVMLVADGLGGSPSLLHRRTELEGARVPHLDRLAQNSAAGLTIPVAYGVTPGSGPGHLALFGYDPFKYLVGRGVIEALGLDLPLSPNEVVARGNFATIDERGVLIDRRAGRIESELASELVQKLNNITVGSMETTVTHSKDYRFVLKLSGSNLAADLTETDPQRTGVIPPIVKARSSVAERTAELVNEFIKKAAAVLANDKPANAILLRGWSSLPTLPTIAEKFRLNSAAIAAYPMYRGLSRLIGMQVLPTGQRFEDEIETLRKHYDEHNFFYIHYKPTDTAGENGDFEGKKRALEILDEYIPTLLSMKPDVLVVAGDHATPTSMAGHSWHPVPLLVHSAYTMGEGVERFTERDLRFGSLGILEAKNVMVLAMAHAGKLLKFGA